MDDRPHDVAHPSVMERYERPFRRRAAIGMVQARAVAAVFVWIQTWMYEPPDGLVAPFPLWVVAVAATGAAVAISVVGWATARSPRIAVVRAGSVLEICADAAVVLAILVAFSFDGDAQLWALLVFPAMEAAWRHRLAGALTAWAGISIGYLLRDMWAASYHDHIDFLAHSVTYRSGVVLIVTLVAGLLARGMHRASVEHLEANIELAQRARTDSLTGLANRDHLHSALTAELARSPHVGVALLDIDGFQAVNDIVGHAAGDKVLAEFATNLAAAADAQDLLARFGGDQFCVLFRGVSDESDAQLRATTLQQAAARPIGAAERRFSLTVSVGVVLADPQHRDVIAVQRAADLAMNHAKRRGRGELAFFAPSMASAMQRRLTLMRDLRRTIGEDGLEVAFQPIVAVDGGVAGFEALVRWDHPAFGQISPPEIVRLAEDAGVAVELGELVLTTACAHVSRWRGTVPDAFVSVNLTARQVDDAALSLQHVRTSLATHDLPTDALLLEVTEGSAVDEGSPIGGLLASVRREGIRVAMDDFGRDRSSLSRLRLLELDVIKLDVELVVDLTQPDRDPRSLASVVQLAASFGLQVVAEGVETPAQQAAVVAAGCDYVQGYLHARPMAAQSVDRWLHQHVCGARGDHGPEANRINVGSDRPR